MHAAGGLGIERERELLLPVERVPGSAQSVVAVAGTVASFGGIDVVLANAGVANNGTVAISPPDALVRTLEVNLIGVVRTVSAAHAPPFAVL